MGMKKSIFTLICCAVLMSSCSTYTGTGAVVGAQMGTILGSAVGGIAGGWRGSDIGAITGMAGGAVVGAVIGQAAEKKEAERYEEYRREREAQRSSRGTYETDSYGTYGDSGYNSQGTGDDRVDFGIPGPKGQQSASSPSTKGQNPQPTIHIGDSSPVTTESRDGFKVQSQLELRNLRVIEGGLDGVLHRGEQCKIVFEMMNRTPHTLVNVCPRVTDETHNKHVVISPDMCVQSIAPGTGVRYTATVVADRKLKDGELRISIGVTLNGSELASQRQEVVLKTTKR